MGAPQAQSHARATSRCMLRRSLTRWVPAEDYTSLSCNAKLTRSHTCCDFATYLGVLVGLNLLQVNPEEEKLARWTTCRLSGERLAPPVCADEMGSLYNKSAVVAGLLSKSLPPSLAHISSLRHLIDLKLEPSQQSGQVGRALRNLNVMFHLLAHLHLFQLQSY